MLARADSTAHWRESCTCSEAEVRLERVARSLSLSLSLSQARLGAHRLHLVRVKEEYMAALAAYKVQGAAWAAAYNAHALLQLEDALQLRLVARIELHKVALGQHSQQG